MAEGVKPRRRYESPLRREQAAATRRTILEAARRLFERDGYAATSIAAIAAEAGVAVKTVYIAFETKSGVLRALWHLSLRGDEEPVPVDQRPWYREVLDEPDPEKRLRLNAHNSRIVKMRAASVMEVMRGAAASDPDIAELWNRMQADFHDNQRKVIELLHEQGALKPELDVDRATDIIWTLNHPDVWQLLVGERGWTPEEFERWLADAFCSQLLRTST
jgi:AcrR family transcriptional regulator